jgi:hypothetical protein
VPDPLDALPTEDLLTLCSGITRWFLAYAFWPCSLDPRRLAVPMRPVVVGLLSALTGVPRIRLGGTVALSGFG